MSKKNGVFFILTCFVFGTFIFSYPAKLYSEEFNVLPTQSIQSLINNALANNDDVDYVLIEPGTYEEQLIINIPQNKEIHLIGRSYENTTISLPSGITGNVISADGGGKIYLENIKITNGTRSGIRINNSTKMNISNCEIANNKSNIGGGIYNYGSILNISNTKVNNNIANLYGGGIYNDGSLTITDSKIINNSSSLSSGGGIYNAGKLNISNSNIADNNSASFSGIDTITSLENNLAKNNWWGSELGPCNLANNPTGTGNSIADNVDFYPFLLSDPFILTPISNNNQPKEEDNGNNDNPPSTPPPDVNNESPSNNQLNSGTNNKSLDNKTLASNWYPSCTLLDHYIYLYDSPIKGFMQLFYNTILLREPDMEGFNHWVNLLESDIKDASGIAECLFFSQENKERIENLNNNDFLKYLYNSILFRDFDESGFNYWILELEKGKTKQDLFNSFTNSAEWEDICLKFKIKP